MGGHRGAARPPYKLFVRKNTVCYAGAQELASYVDAWQMAGVGSFREAKGGC